MSSKAHLPVAGALGHFCTQGRSGAACDWEQQPSIVA